MAKRTSGADASASAGKKQKASKLVARYAALGLVYDPLKKVVEQTTPEQRKLLKVAAFKEIGRARVRRAVKAIKAVGQLSNSGSYSYTPEQVEMISNLLELALSETMALFAKGTKAGPVEVEL